MDKIRKIKLLLNTVRHLKSTQVLNQFKNRLKKTKPLSSYTSSFSEVVNLDFFDISEAYSYLEVNSPMYSFDFLNLKKDFKETIDWNFSEYGKLWNYNLQYLDYLRQINLDLEDKIALIHSLYSNLNAGKLILEPYPASLRIMNLIRFVSTNEMDENNRSKINSYIKSESEYLNSNLEYHILANHLLENAFAINMSATYFNDRSQKIKYEKLLINQLDEQILNDGAHFELSPMYHKIIFFRVLELYYYTDNNSDFKQYLKQKVSKMLTWLKNFSFNNGEVADFNDSTRGITYSNAYFYSLCNELGINEIDIPLSDSYYRKFSTNDFELVIDINGISPSYQPGHAHADTFSFCLNYKNNPIVVDSGISTYNICPQRNWERSTDSHNTVSINNQNSSEVWSGFRVGRRAKVTIKEDFTQKISASHDGYKNLGVIVNRKVESDEKGFVIEDILTGIKKNQEAWFNIHFHPNVKIENPYKNEFTINNEIQICFERDSESVINDYIFPTGYNLFEKSLKITVKFKSNNCKTTIKKIS